MSSKPWHKRWHGNALNGMRGLTLEERGAYQTLLDLMYDHGGPWRFDERRLCGEWDCDVRVCRRVLSSLIAKGKIRPWADADEQVYLVNDKVVEELGEGPFDPSTSAELPANFREKFAIAIGQLSSKSPKKPKQNKPAKIEAPKKASLEEEEEEETPNPLGETDLFGGPVEDTMTPPADLALAAYNELALRLGKNAAIATMNDSRRSKLNARMNGKGLTIWKHALELVEKSPFLCGEVDPPAGRKRFRLDLDFMLQPSSFQKILEGFYGDGRVAPVAAVPAKDWDRDRWLVIKERYDDTGRWPDTAGPRPGEPGCLMPKDL